MFIEYKKSLHIIIRIALAMLFLLTTSLGTSEATPKAKRAATKTETARVVDQRPQTGQVIDVSQWQGDIDWQKVNQQVDLAIIRTQYGSEANEASYRLDTKKDEYYQAAKQNKLPFASYAFSQFTSVEGAKQAADSFYAHADKQSKFYVLDDEDHVGDASEQVYINAWLARMRQLTKKKIVLYTYSSYLKENQLDASQFDGTWIADYSANQPQNSDLWQYTSQGHVDGINGDVDISKTTSDQIYNWIKS
ncbi:glycoside hydrolase family protein [Lactobacillus selangorensis]|uniref:Glycoside hydrolase family protein n=1 Tax=Lactobacillus selangorensis TaxID=81857 RepID=A0A0R2FQ49_9LACO|nr:GH25 family lysozyme [Lactobacillus selangorensis]KRN27977.1 glycoside hydrolase family protein [Lactobacillus selangorensis]KRN30552.1 glycoside hydrolase family protein [Lactobacillus selangorensis]